MSSVRVLRHGAEREPVLVIDGAIPYADEAIGQATRATFRPIGAHFPGVRCEVPAATTDLMVAVMGDAIAQTFSLPRRPTVIEAFYSLITTPPGDLEPVQRAPHADSTDPDYIAMIVYLSRGQHGGTSFYRHRPTGVETVREANGPRYYRQLRKGMKAHVAATSGYICGDGPIFERIAQHGFVFNRAIVYRGRCLHSADMAPGACLSSDPAKGRLTLTAFLRPEPADRARADRSADRAHA